MPGPTPCSRCGAPLPLADGLRVCALCGQVHDPEPVVVPGAAGQGRRARAAGSSPPVGGPGSAAPDPGARLVGWIVGLSVGVSILVAGAGIVLGIWSWTTATDADIDGVVETDLSPTTGDLLVLPGALDDDPAVVTMATRVGGDGERVVALVELDEGPVWEAEVVPDDVSSAQLLATDGVVLASLGRTVVGLDRATGEELWEAEATDEVAPYCADCFVVVDGTLVVLATDGEVRAFDPATGAVRWEHAFASVNGRVVPVADGLLLVDEAPETDPQAALSMVLVDPADRAERNRFAPGCTVDFAGSPHALSAQPTLPVIPVPDSDDVVIAYGSFPGCVQRWTVTTGEQRWSRTTEGRLDWYDVDDRPWALGPTEVVIAGYEAWMVLGLAEGGLTEVPVPADSTAAPAVAIAGDAFVGAVSSTRGTAEWSLVAHDLRSGEEAWTRDLGPDTKPAVVGAWSTTESVYDSSIFAFGPTGDGLHLLSIGPPGPRASIAALDPATGEGRLRAGDALRTDMPDTASARIHTVRDGHALVDASGVLQVVDLATGEISTAWGR